MKENKRMGCIKHPLFYLTAGFLVTLGLLVCLNTPAVARDNKVPLTDVVKEVPKRPAVFDKDIKPLTIEQCAQCHTGVFKLLKSKGTRHQLPCRFCHTKYHTYAPGKVEYADAIPQCETCHGQPHGTDADVSTCNNCHSNAHSPLVIPDITADQCFRCHKNPLQTLKDFPSKHTELACTDCHTSHGYIPNCTECHSEDGGVVYHIQGPQKNSNCLSCHKGPHDPLVISYSEDTPKEFCANCHKNPSHAPVYKTLKASNSKHWTEITCASCHDEHGKIPECSNCHDNEGHRANLKTADCLRCHTNPHDPLKITFSLDEPKEICGGCHTDVYKMLMESKNRHTNQTCSFCHPHHGEIPTCQKCHGVPHGKRFMDRFNGKCGACHGIAHVILGRMKDDREGSLTAEGRKGFLTTVK